MSALIDWLRFSAWLAHVLSVLPENESFGLMLESDDDDSGAARYVQFCAYGPGMLRCEVVSNEYLAASRQHTTEDLSWLADQGWGEPNEDDPQGSPNHYLDVAVEWSELAADLAVRVLRDLWGVTKASELSTGEEEMREYIESGGPVDLR